MEAIFCTEHPSVVDVVADARRNNAKTAGIFNVCAQVFEFCVLPEIQASLNLHIHSHRTIIGWMIFAIMINIYEEESVTPFVGFVHL